MLEGSGRTSLPSLPSSSGCSATDIMHLRLVLPRIRMQQCHNEVLKILQKIKDLDVIVETAEDVQIAPITVAEVSDRMLPDPFDGFSDTLNVDTTLLLAFASDLSYDSVESKDWHHRMIFHQIKMEKQDHLLPSVLWPACGIRRLVCTREAADRALEIVATSKLFSNRLKRHFLIHHIHSRVLHYMRVSFG